MRAQRPRNIPGSLNSRAPSSRTDPAVRSPIRSRRNWWGEVDGGGSVRPRRPMSDIRIERVADAAGLRRFVDVPFPIYRDDPYWVPPLRFERLQHLDPKRNPWFEHGEAALFVASRNGQPVGRIS